MTGVEKLIETLRTTLSDEVVLFPGTFAPWHQGHQACITLMGDALPIIITPDRNPEKLPVPTDLQTIRSLVDKNANLSLFEAFLENEESNPTYFWYDQLKKELNNKKISLLMGFDSYASISGWIQGHELLEIVDHIYVAARLNLREDFEKKKSEYQKIASSFTASFLGHHQFENLSSTKINQG